ncbi:uncharacterized protein [Sinocyclocheilus grahami]|uniref:uncharacterized protein isoform X5 n=1 Tax=Sinocyclocheilus grahami TaxID=75366 RepID=UPI0007AD5741|nr:PREDICTED: uncharacterized protein LOC107564224 isoform X5 [Sinocyclocheilus grahami]
MTLLKCQHCVREDKAAEDTDHVEMTTEEQVQKWLEDFQKSSALTWRKSRTYPDSGRYNKYRVDLRCQHKTYSSSSKTTKNTNCPATMFLILKRFMYERKSRSGDPHLEEGYFLHVNLRNEHNHRLNTAEAMRWRDVSNDTIEKLQQLYKSGHSPSSALKNIKYSLQEEEGDNYIYATADRSICPDLQFCYRLYHKLFQKACAEPAGKDISDELFKPLELEQSWETAAMTAEGHTACIEDGVSVDAVPIITTAEHFTEDNEPGPSAAEEVVGSLDGQLEEIFGMLKKKLNEDASFTPPIRAFVSSFFQIKTDSALQASLFSFGKTTPIINQINVLPATGPWRRGALAGRRAVGRPPKNSRREHPYCNSRSNNNPQTLTFCLQDNNTLEKTD